MGLSPQQLKEIQSYGFRPAKVRDPDVRRLWIGTDGRPSTGKTDFMLRSTPGPVFFINLDLGTDDIEEKMVIEYGRDDLVFLDLRLPTRKKTEVDLMREDCGVAWDKAYLGMKDACKSGIFRTICVDTGDALWRALRVSELGAVKGVPPMKYEQVNSFMSNFLNMPQNHNLHFICAHRVKPVYAPDEYEKDGEQKSFRKPTGEYERTGFSQTEFIFRVNLRHLNRKARKYNKATKTIEETNGLEFGFRVEKCTANPRIVGKEYWGDEATFQALGTYVYPDTELEDWE